MVNKPLLKALFLMGVPYMGVGGLAMKVAWLGDLPPAEKGLLGKDIPSGKPNIPGWHISIFNRKPRWWQLKCCLFLLILGGNDAI